ncbi:Iron(II)-dependent oxidoreductase EgtB [Posidoniimonas polymericola]|uniref:Iron(II)-dependent oxidoreductase EgtB n=1 Tax=Posidoniimonas polymericola TaxID=2528002 RepID=A0A5C5YKU6_9BACT|nr:ergothioneine biosynthesis protein EgtB [Posidoniimonas polymericola]TWT75496.1 Iron(II)-dependent oxidoreductase EgtB [Posidoniimonas polymericola]
MSLLTTTPGNTKPSLSERYAGVRGFTDRLTADLGPEDATVQSMSDASPVKWHLAHTTWFFETFVLARLDGYRPVDAAFESLFNSYYNTVGTPFPRALRGVLSRPTLDQARRYRRAVDESLRGALDAGLTERDPDAAAIIELGLHHEQQHQELILTDIKHAFSINPLQPAVIPGGLDQEPAVAAPDTGWTTFDEGNYEVGHADAGFAYDNESPRHRVWLDAYQLRNSPATCGEYQAFIADDGYSRPELWLSEGWATVQGEGWAAPIYWRNDGGDWSEFSLAGRIPLQADRPVTHLSYFEADAFARWSGARLPTEAEWEAAAAAQPIVGNFADVLMQSGLAPHPAAEVRHAEDDVGPLCRLYGDSWEWTSSSYTAYPGYRPPPGALGEYNGKFMCNQYVLRGGSCASSSDHLRATYRNFFSTAARWQFSGVRLARLA